MLSVGYCRYQFENLPNDNFFFFNFSDVGEEKEKTTAGASRKLDPFQRAKLAALPAHKQNRLTKALVYHLIDDMRPFSTVESKSFRNLVREFEPAYKFPSAATVSEQIIPAWYNKTKQVLQEELNMAPFVAITTDAWTSRRTMSYTTYTVHYITDKLQAKVLDTHSLSGNHTGENLAKDMKNTLAAWKLTEKLTAVTTDNAANIVMGCSILQKSLPNVIHLPCFAHTLNLAAQKANDTIQETTKLINNVISYFHHSSIGKEVLREKQVALNLPVHDLVTECPTRWNSGYLAKKRFLEQRPAIIAATLDPRLSKKKDAPSLSDAHITMIEEYLGVMEELYQATTLMSAEQMATAGLVLPILTKLLSKFAPCEEDSHFVEEIKAALHADLSKRYNKEEVKQFLEEASALDPRTKNRKCISYDTWLRLEEMLVEIIDAEEENTPNTIEVEQPTPEIKRRKIYALLEDEEDDNEDSVEGALLPVQVAKAEIESYRREPRIAYEEDPVKYWKSSTTKYLPRLAMKYLVVQGTSVPSERIFSTAGDIVSAQRSCLKEESVSALIFLKKNMSAPLEL